MELTEYVGQYVMRHDVRAGTEHQLRISAKLLTKFNGGSLLIHVLTDELLNRFILSRQRAIRATGKPLEPETVRSNRGSLLMLWNDAAEQGLCKAPGKIRVVKVPKKIKRAFLADELCAIIARAEKLRGTFSNGEDRRLWTVSLINAYYDTALRLSDLLSVEANWIWRPGLFISIVQSKTGESKRAFLRAETITAIDAQLVGRTTGPIWPLWAKPKQFFDFFRRLVREAGLNGGTSKWIRRSAASYTAAKYGKSAAQTLLGHKTAGLFETNYCDDRIYHETPLLPPPLAG